MFSAKEMREFNQYKGTLGEFVSRKREGRITKAMYPHLLLEICSDILGVPYEVCLSKKKTQEAVRARYFSMYFLKALCPEKSLAKVGQLLGREHSLVIYGLKEIKRVIDPRFKDPGYDVYRRIQKEVEIRTGFYVA